jgi:hypothetical protein
MSCKMIDWLISKEPEPHPPIASLPLYQLVMKARLAMQPEGFQTYLADEATLEVVERLNSESQ